MTMGLVLASAAEPLIAGGVLVGLIAGVLAFIRGV
jgi:hypothetical protein